MRFRPKSRTVGFDKETSQSMHWTLPVKMSLALSDNFDQAAQEEDVFALYNKAVDASSAALSSACSSVSITDLDTSNWTDEDLEYDEDLSMSSAKRGVKLPSGTKVISVYCEGHACEEPDELQSGAPLTVTADITAKMYVMDQVDLNQLKDDLTRALKEKIAAEIELCPHLSGGVQDIEISGN